jgi:hypothetical protein
MENADDESEDEFSVHSESLNKNLPKKAPIKEAEKINNSYRMSKIKYFFNKEVSV